MPRSRIRRGRKTTKRRPFGRFRRHRRKGPTQRSIGVGRGVLHDKPRELVIHKGLGFPGRMRTKLRYVESIGVTSTAGAVGAYAFNANGLYDPNDSGGGHQPMYFDQYMTVYDHYKVLGSVITVRPIETGTTLINPMFATVIQNDDNSIAGTSVFGQTIEWGMLDTYRIFGGPYAQGHKPIICKYSTRRNYKDKYQSDSLIGDATHNPTETSTFIIVQQPMDASSTVTVSYLVIIDYIVDFFELRDIAQS